jgi:hypothetical protein
LEASVDVIINVLLLGFKGRNVELNISGRWTSWILDIWIGCVLLLKIYFDGGEW